MALAKREARSRLTAHCMAMPVQPPSAELLVFCTPKPSATPAHIHETISGQKFVSGGDVTDNKNGNTIARAKKPKVKIRICRALPIEGTWLGCSLRCSVAFFVTPCSGHEFDEKMQRQLRCHVDCRTCEEAVPRAQNQWHQSCIFFRFTNFANQGEGVHAI